MQRMSYAVLLLLCFWHAATAQPLCHVTSYYETSRHEPFYHVNGMLQDANGMIWVTSWGGMFSFDGIKFTIHDEQQTKAQGVTPNQSRGIEPCPTGENWHLADKGTEEFFTDVNGTTWHIDSKGQLFYRTKGEAEKTYSDIKPFDGYRGCFADRQGNWWVMCYYAIHKLEFSQNRLTPIRECIGHPMRCMVHLADGSYWLCHRLKPHVLVYDKDDHLKGYLSRNGEVTPRPSEFFAPMYCSYTSHNGTIWVGTKGSGAYQLTANGANNFIIKKIECQVAKCEDVYAITEDRQGRIWMATLNGGVICVGKDSLVAKHLPCYNYKAFTRAHSLTLLQDTLVIGTSQGLLVADVSKTQTTDIRFKAHRYDKQNNRGLSSNLVDYVMYDKSGRLLVCTENGGLNICQSASLLDEELTFKHIDSRDGLPDIALAVTEDETSYWLTSLYSLSCISKAEGRIESTRFGQSFFGYRYRFDEIPPLMLNKDKWIVSTDHGAMMLDTKGMTDKGYRPNILLTRLQIGNSEYKYLSIPNHIQLPRDQRSFQMDFAALDFCNTSDISYYYRYADGDSTWISLGNTATLSFAEIKPGKHTLEICSTNGQGQWADNTLQITIEAEARFTETIWALVLLIALCTLGGWGVIYLVIYVRRIKQKHREMLAEYLLVIGKREETLSAIQASAATNPNDENKDFVAKLTEYISTNLSNPDLRTEMMAEHMSVSISTLTRMTKSLMGVTPGEFLSKARIRKAETILLQQKHLSISEVAYLCGFNDPKYFSRSFKNETKKSPTEYRAATEA